jgi:hypothetical protein
MAEKLTLAEQQGLIGELKSLLDGVSDLDERRSILSSFAEKKRMEGIVVPLEEFSSLIEGPRPPGRPRGSSVNLEGLCPVLLVKIPRANVQVPVPVTRESLLVRNYITTEAVRQMIEGHVNYLLKRMHDSKGNDGPDLDELTKISRLVAENNANAEKELHQISKILDTKNEEMDFDGLKEGFEAYVEKFRGKKKATTSHADVLDLAKNITNSIKKEDANLLGELK